MRSLATVHLLVERDADRLRLARDHVAVAIDGHERLAGDRVAVGLEIRTPAAARHADPTSDDREEVLRCAEVEMQVRPRAVAGVARQPDPFAALHALAVLH